MSEIDDEREPDEGDGEGEGWEHAKVVDEQPATADGRPICDVCGKDFKNERSLREHKREYHRTDGKQPRSHRGGSSSGDGAPRRTRATGGDRQRRRAQLVRETLQEITSFTDELRGRSSAPDRDLADVIRNDAAKIADSVGWLAERFNPLGRLIDYTAGHGGIITIGRGFSGVGTWVLRRWRSLLAERAAEQPVEGVVYLDELDEQQQVEVVDGEPGVPPLV